MTFPWSRWCEVLIGGWLIASPFVFEHPGEHTGLWATDLASGALVILFAVIAMLVPPYRAHYASLLVVAWLAGFGYFAGSSPVSAALQNDLLTGLLLLLFVVLPTSNIGPPEEWVAFHERHAR